MSNYLVVRPGDIVFNKLRTWQGGLGVSRHAGIVSPAYFVCRPQEAIDPRYYHYLLRSNVYLAELTRLSKFMPPSQFDIAWCDLRTLPVLHPPLIEQRVIADFLDSETARIDALVAKKQQLITLLEERWQSIVSERVWGSILARTRLKYLAGLPTSGNRDHGSFTDDDSGVPCLRGLNVRSARLDLSQLRFISVEDHARQAQTQLQEGDIVIVRSGLAGAAARIPPELQPCNCVDLVVVPRSTMLDSRFVEYVINSNEAQEQVSQNSVGAFLTHFNAIDAGNLSIPDLPIARQRAIAEALDREQERQLSLMTSLANQADLLAEQRQALITTAVTGELVVPGAA